MKTPPGDDFAYRAQTMPSERVQRRIDRLLDQAEEAADEFNWVRVRNASLSVLGVDPDNDDAKSFLILAEPHLEDTEADVAAASTYSTPQVSADTCTPTSFANGRYEVTGFLGEGGKKKVYIAHDTTLDRDVAFALIKTEGLDDTSRQRVTREAQAMARLGDNPNIMPIFDLGEENGQPYMVGPLMGGGDVESLIENAEDGRLSLEDALRIASEICHGLEFAHSKSIIHRDLKPGNVWLTEDGTARIGDFGLAISLDRSRLTQEKMMVGTVSYMPPEQATGGEVTPQSDLYSLGAMLYEMLTGRPPFLGDDEIAIISQHVNTPPVAPAWHNPSVPIQLDALVMRMLAKDPSERPDSAADVLAVLGSINLSELTADATSEKEQGRGVGSLESMAGGVFVGRTREMDLLKGALESSLAGRGRMLTLVGDPGIGKTRTALELETYAGLRKAQVLWGRCYEDSGAPPYWPWVQAIRSYVSQKDPDELRAEMGSLASIIAEIVPDVRERLGDVQAAPNLDDPDSARFRLFDAVVSFLKTAANSKPLLLILDDLHWADKPSLQLLEFAVRELASSRILLIGTYRDMELNRRHPLSVTLGDLGRERLFERVVLRGISKEDIHRFIELAAGIQPPQALVQSVYLQTEGNPLFVTEIVRLFIQEGDLTPESLASTDSWSVRTPQGIREAIGRRLDKLSERTNEVLTAASVIGRQFLLEHLGAILDDLSEDRILDALDESLRARVIEELPTEIGCYQFTHALIQQTLSDELSTTRRARVHARIAEALERIYGESADDHAEALAYHFGEAEAVAGPERVTHYSLLAGQQALAAYAYDQALEHFENGLAAKGGAVSDPESAALTFGLARAQASTFSANEMEHAVATLDSAVAFYMGTGRLDDAINAAGIEIVPVTDRGGEGTKWANTIERVLPFVEDDSPDVCRLLSKYAHALAVERGDREGAQKAIDRAITISRRLESEYLELAAMEVQLSLHNQNANWEGLHRDAGTVVDLAQRHSDEKKELRGHYFQGMANLALGKLSAAGPELRTMLSLAESLKDINNLEQALGFNAVLCLMRGDWAGANRFSERIYEFVQASGRFAWHIKLSDWATGNFVLPDGSLGSLDLYNLYGGGPIPVTDKSDVIATVLEHATLTYEDSATTWLYRFPALLKLALAASELSDNSKAAEYYDALLSHVPHNDPFTGIHSQRVLGTLGHLLGRLDESEAHFNAAIRFLEESGQRPELAICQTAFAEMLLDRDRPGDRATVTQLQDAAIAAATELGMKPLLERVLAQREILKA